MRQKKCEVIICHKAPYFERDIAIDAFSEQWGKIKLIAKNAQGKSRRFNGKLELTTIVNCELVRGKSQYILTECEMVEGFSKIRESYNHILLACYCVDIIRQATHYQQRNPELYFLLKNTLHTINDGVTHLESIQRTFESAFLWVEGLIREQKEVSFSEFRRLYEDYCSKIVKAPGYIRI